MLWFLTENSGPYCKKAQGQKATSNKAPVHFFNQRLNVKKPYVQRLLISKVQTMVQWCQMKNQQIPFYVVNNGNLNHHYKPYKSFKSLVLWSSNRYEIDLSNEVLDIFFGQEAEKISEVKVEIQRKYLPTRLDPGAWIRTRLSIKINV